MTSSLAASGNDMFAGTGNNGVFYSSNNGNNWVQTSLNNKNVRVMEIIGAYIFAGCFYNTKGVYVSSNNGVNWALTPLNNKETWAFAVSGQHLLAGTDSGVYVTSDYGTTWIQKNDGLPGDIIYSLLIANNYVFAGVDRYSMWRRPLSEVIGIRKISTTIPNNFSLPQNYPNPFNSSTKFKFEVPVASHVKIIIYDILGKEIAVLLNERLSPGIYETAWDANNYSSGIYFCKLVTNKYVSTKKMCLTK